MSRRRRIALGVLAALVVALAVSAWWAYRTVRGTHGLELARLSPLAEWHYRTAHRDSFVSIDKARRLLGWEPRRSNAETLCETFDWYLAHLEAMRTAGTTHRVPWDQRALALLRRVS